MTEVQPPAAPLTARTCAALGGGRCGRNLHDVRIDVTIDLTDVPGWNQNGPDWDYESPSQYPYQ